MQIVQFIFGASFALSHLFIVYESPVSVPYTVSFADMASAVAGDISSVVSVATATASADIGSWLKKAAFRAAGREGLAENVVNRRGETFGIDPIHAAKDLKAREETRYRDELQMTHCMDTSGQAFAILLNCMYLAPLTWQFVRFFVRSYLKRIERRGSSTSTAQVIGKSGRDASKGLQRQVADMIGEPHGGD